jgi:hypothetical protein
VLRLKFENAVDHCVFIEQLTFSKPNRVGRTSALLIRAYGARRFAFSRAHFFIEMHVILYAALVADIVLLIYPFGINQIPEAYLSHLIIFLKYVLGGGGARPIALAIGPRVECPLPLCSSFKRISVAFCADSS